MQKKPDTPEAILLRLIEAEAVASFNDNLEKVLGSQTFVGGKRVVKQDLPSLPKKAATTVHQVKVNLHGAKPPIWRRLEIPSAMTLDLVHEVLQIAFKWDDYHLHAFETVCGEFGAPGQDDWSEGDDESGATLAQVAAEEKAKVVYVYDFGDDWRHDIVVEKIVPAEPGVAYPRCTGGRGSVPGEDSGGIWAFNAMLAEDGASGAAKFDPAFVTEQLADLADVIISRPEGS